MTTGYALITGAALLFACAVYCMIRILMYLRSRGERIRWFLLGLNWFGYMYRYRELTLDQSGRPGIYHTVYVVLSTLALILVIAGSLVMDGTL